MNAHDARFLTTLRQGPSKAAARYPIQLSRLSSGSREALEDLILGLERKLGAQGRPASGVRDEVYELLGITRVAD